MAKFNRHAWWMLTALLVTPAVVLAAGVPNVFSPNTVISSAAMNANFANLADRVTALEARKTTVTPLFANVGGPIQNTLASPFTTKGGPVLIIASGTGSTNAANSFVNFNLKLDGSEFGGMDAYSTEANSHKAVATRAFSFPTLAAGDHTLQIVLGNTTTLSDSADNYQVTVVEFGQ